MKERKLVLERRKGRKREKEEEEGSEGEQLCL